MEEEEASTPVYHERQSLLRCGVHCVNNVLQRPAYTQQDFATIQDELDTGTGGRWAVSTWLGNFDINVMMLALKREGLVVEWFDKRLNFFEEERIQDPRCEAVIVNRRASAWVPFTGRHWLCLKRFGGQWVNLDSSIARPRRFASVDAMQKAVVSLLQRDDGECLLVMRE